MADFPKSHGLQIATNGHIKNLVTETLTTAQEGALVLHSYDLGRIWFNSTLNQYRSVISDGSTGYIITSLIGSATGNAGITIKDEGTTVAEGVETLNFVGADIRSMDDGSRQVTIYSPPPMYPNHYNSSTTPDTGFVSNAISDWSTNVVNRIIASPTSEGTPFFTNGWAGASHPTVPTTQTTFTYTTPGTANNLFETTTSNIVAEVLTGATSSTVSATCTLSNIGGNATQSNQGITVAVTSWSTQFDKYKASIGVTFDISTLVASGDLSNGGRFRLKITHNDKGSSYSKYQDLFMNKITASSFNATTGAVDIIPGSSTQVKSISGVDYFANGTTWDVSVTDVDNLNNMSYVDPLLGLDMTPYGLSSVNINRADATWTGLNTAYDNAGADFAKNYTMANSTYRRLASGVQITAVTKGNTTSGGTKSSTAANVLIDGYGTTATRYAEEFDNEAERLKNNDAAAPTAEWSATAALAATDAFIQNGKLQRIPTVNYSTGWLPDTNHVNYTANTNAQVFIREFRSNSLEKVNGLIEIGGDNITEAAIIAKSVILEVSTNGTTWGNINDSDKYRIDKNLYNLNLSGGNKRVRFGLGAVNGNPELGGVSSTTGLSSYGMFLRVTIPNGSTVAVDYLRITDWS